MNIIIDTKGESSLTTRDRLIDSDDDDLDLEDIGFDTSKKLNIKKTKKQLKSKSSPKKDIDLEEFESDMGWNNKRLKMPKKAVKSVINVDKLMNEIDPIEKVLEKSSITPGFEQLNSIPRYDVSRRVHLTASRKEREKTKGKKWFNLPATEMTPEIKHDLQIIQMRSVLDPKHFYKKNDIKALPKYFQIGKVVDSPIDYYNSRLTKKERKKTIVDELMADAEFAKFNKRKYKEIIQNKRLKHSKAHKHAKKLKSKRK